MEPLLSYTLPCALKSPFWENKLNAFFSRPSTYRLQRESSAIFFFMKIFYLRFREVLLVKFFDSCNGKRKTGLRINFFSNNWIVSTNSWQSLVVSVWWPWHQLNLKTYIFYLLSSKLQMLADTFFNKIKPHWQNTNENIKNQNSIPEAYLGPRQTSLVRPFYITS